MTLITICECVQLITVYSDSDNNMEICSVGYSDSDNNMGTCSVGYSVVTLITIWECVQLVTLLSL